MKIDHLREGEKLPGEGLQMPAPEMDWIWVVRDDFDVIVAYMICLRGNGVIMPIRIQRLDGAPPMWVAMLLRHVVRDCAARGFEMYLVWLGDETEEQRELRAMCVKRGAKMIPMNGDIVAGRTAPFAEAKCLLQ